MNRFRVVTLLIGVIFSLSYLKADNGIPLRTWSSERARLTERDKIHQSELCIDRYHQIKKSPLSVSFKSAIWPGLGQFQVEQNTRGSIYAISSGLVILGGGICYFVRQTAYEEYKTADNIDDIEKYYTKAENFNKYTLYCGAAFGAIWLANIVDSYFSTRSFNSKLLSRCFADAELQPSLQMNNEGAFCIGITKKF